MTQKCSNCEQILKEDRQLRKNVAEIHTNYVEVVNENLALRREIEALRSAKEV